MASSDYSFKRFSEHEFYGQQNALLVDLAGVGPGSESSTSRVEQAASRRSSPTA